MTSQTKLEDLIETLDDIIFEVDEDGIFLNVWCSRPENLYLPPNQFLGRSVKEVLPGFIAESTTRAIALSLAGEENVAFEYPSPNKDRGLIWYRARFRQIRTKGGKRRFSLAISDITNMKAAQNHLIESTRATSLSDVVGGIAHEINNPLAIITGKTRKLARLLEKTIRDFDKQKDIDDILEAASRIAKIVAELDILSQPETSGPSKVVSVHSLVDTAVALCQNKSRDSGVRIESTIAELFLNCRNNQMLQVFVQLLTNAIDAASQLQDKWVRIDCKLTSDQKRILIAFTDSGQGIPADIQEKLMRPFFTTKPAGKGAGLGLNIARKIVDEHGGKLYFDPSFLNTRFIVELPHKSLD